MEGFEGNIIRTPSIRVVLHFRWPVAEGSPGLLPQDIERLAPYTVRYAQTLGVAVYAVGGVADHLHLLLDLRPTLSIDELNEELQRTTGRFLRDVLGRTGFAWSEDGLLFTSASPDHIAEMSEYIRDQPLLHATGRTDPYLEYEDEEDDAGAEGEPGDDEEMPEWLRGVLPEE